MAYKLILSWDVLPDKRTEYEQFLKEDYLPFLNQAGFLISDYWYCLFGSQPEIMIEAQILNKSEALRFVSSVEWQEINLTLQDMIENYDVKIVPDRGKLQIS